MDESREGEEGGATGRSGIISTEEDALTPAVACGEIEALRTVAAHPHPHILPLLDEIHDPRHIYVVRLTLTLTLTLNLRILTRGRLPPRGRGTSS